MDIYQIARMAIERNKLKSVDVYEDIGNGNLYVKIREEFIETSFAGFFEAVRMVRLNNSDDCVETIVNGFYDGNAMYSGKIWAMSPFRRNMKLVRSVKISPKLSPLSPLDRDLLASEIDSHIDEMKELKKELFKEV